MEENMKKRYSHVKSGLSNSAGRRNFLKSSLVAGAGSVIFGNLPSEAFSEKKTERRNSNTGVMVKVLGTAQDGGFPQMACYCENCRLARQNPMLARKVVSLGVLNFSTKKSFMLEATPDAARQVEMIHDVDSRFKRPDRLAGNPIDGILLTHADIGHYVGLFQFRPEVTPIRNLPVYCTEIMAKFLSDNEPWKLMVERNLIELRTFSFNTRVRLDEEITFEAYKIPHDKYSDMAGYKIIGPKKTLLFIPDIDYWEDRFIDIVGSVDYAFVDATFYSGGDRPGRPDPGKPGRHPYIMESMDFFKEIADTKKTAIYFTHFNHSNRVLGRDKSIRQTIEDRGFFVSDDGDELWL